MLLAQFNAWQRVHRNWQDARDRIVGRRDRTESLERLGERNLFDQLNEFEHVTANVTAKAVKTLIVYIDDKTGRRIVVKGAVHQ
jgi:hypothetical protein